MKRIPAEDFTEYLEFLRENNDPYYLYTNRHSQTVVSGFGDYYTSVTRIPPNELFLIRLVKNHCNTKRVWRNVENTLPQNPRNIPYLNFSNKILFRNKKLIFEKRPIYEVDTNSTYWRAAYKMGIIDKKIYMKGLTVHKQTRLAALGALGKQTSAYRYSPRKKIEVPIKPLREKKTEFLWFSICNYIGQMFQEAKNLSGDDFIFYWFDNIFVHDLDNVGLLKEYFKSHDFGSKHYKVDSIQISIKHKNVRVESWEHAALETKPGMDPNEKRAFRNFSFSVRDIHKSIIIPKDAGIKLPPTGVTLFAK